MNGDADLVAFSILCLRDAIFYAIEEARAVDPELVTDEQKKRKLAFVQLMAQREQTLINVLNQRAQQMAHAEMARAMAPPPKIVRP